MVSSQEMTGGHHISIIPVNANPIVKDLLHINHYMIEKNLRNLHNISCLLELEHLNICQHPLIVFLSTLISQMSLVKNCYGLMSNLPINQKANCTVMLYMKHLKEKNVCNINIYSFFNLQIII